MFSFFPSLSHLLSSDGHLGGELWPYNRRGASRGGRPVQGPQCNHGHANEQSSRVHRDGPGPEGQEKDRWQEKYWLEMKCYVNADIISSKFKHSKITRCVKCLPLLCCFSIILWSFFFLTSWAERLCGSGSVGEEAAVHGQWGWSGRWTVNKEFYHEKVSHFGGSQQCLFNMLKKTALCCERSTFLRLESVSYMSWTPQKWKGKNSLSFKCFAFSTF